MISFLKKIPRALGRNVILSLRWIISRLSYPVYRSVSWVFIVLGIPFLISKRRLALLNLRRAYENEKDDKEIKAILKACFRNFAWGMIDLIYWIDREEEMKKNIAIEGKKNLDDALKEGTGAILVSAHFGSFILMYLRLALEGYKTSVIMRRTRDSAFEQHLSDFRNERRINTIYDLPARKCVVDCLKALRNNEVLFILLDQNYGQDSRVFVDFFGQKAATATGPVVFSQRTKAPVLPVFIMRDQKRGRIDYHKVVIGDEIGLEEKEDDLENMVVNVDKITKVIEKKIREHPFEWGGWMHRRWKSKMTPKERILMDNLAEKGKREAETTFNG